MTDKEAIEILKDLWRWEHPNWLEKDIRQALDKGIEALETQNSIIEEFEKIKAKIQNNTIRRTIVEDSVGYAYTRYKDYIISEDNVMNIIDERISELKGE